MRLLLKKTILIPLLLVSLIVNASVAAAQEEQEQYEKGLFTFVAPLLVDTLQEVVTALVQRGAQTIFEYISTIGQTDQDEVDAEEANADASDSEESDTAEESVSTETTTVSEVVGASFSTTSPFISHEQARILSQQPLFALSINKYSSGDVDETPIEKVTFGFGEPLGFTIKTDEYFALTFDTSTPGRVKLKNTDVHGKVEQVGYYEVVGASENRMPRNTNILMYGDPGLETLDIEFTPCVSAKLKSNPMVSPYVGILPGCDDSGPVAKSGLPIPKKMSQVQNKGMYNAEANTHPAIALLAVSENTAKTGETHSIRVYVEHISQSL